MTLTSRRGCSRTKLFHAIVLACAAATTASPAAAQMVKSGAYIAIGEADELQGDANAAADAVAIGSNSNAQGAKSIAFGSEAVTWNEGAVAIGYSSSAAGPFAIALGSDASANAEGSLAFGNNAYTTGSWSIAMGDSAQSFGMWSIGLGDHAMAAGNGAVAVGSNSSASTDNSVAVGKSSLASGASAVAIGNYASASYDRSVAVGKSAYASNTFASAFGSESEASGSQTVALGYQTTATGDMSTSLGSLANASGQLALAVGKSASATNTSAVAVGSNANASNTYTTAIGGQAAATSSGAVALGYDARATMGSAMAFGYQSRAGGQYGIAMGWNASANGNASIAIGQSSRANTADAIAIGQNAVADRSWSVSFGNLSQKRQLANVEAGTDYYDAVNVGQLGTAKSDLRGEITTAKADLRGEMTTSATALQGQVTGIDSRLSALESVPGVDVDAALESRLTALGLSDGNGNNKAAVAYDYGTESEISLDGVAGTYIHNIADGEVSSSSMDAVNGRQLHAVQQALNDEVAYWDDQMGIFASTIDTTFEDMGLRDLDGTTRKVLTYDRYSSEGQITLAGFFGTKITNVAPGDVTVSSTDAVNGGQLFAVQNHLNGVADSTNMLFGEITNINNAVWGSLEDAGIYDSNTGDVFKAATYDFGTNDALMSLAGGAGTRITNLAAGNIALGSSDAVNGGQIASIRDSLEASIAGVDARVDGIVSSGPGADPAELTALTTRVDGIDTSIGNLTTGLSTLSQDTRNYFTNAGLMDGLGNMRLAVSYDHGDGSSLTLAGLGGTLLTNLSNGSVAIGSTDAINGGQVAAIRDELKGDIAGLDTRVDGIETGTPGSGLDDIEDSIAAVDGRVDSLTTLVGNNYQQFKDAGLVDSSGNVLSAATYDLGTSRGVMTFGGTSGTLLANVAPGLIAAGSMEAVNGGQIDALRAQLQGRLDGLDSRLGTVEAGGGTGGTIDPAQLSEINGKISSLDGRVSTVEGGLIAANSRIDSMQSNPGTVTGPIEAPVAENKPAPTATGDGAIAAGSGAKATADNTVALGTDSVADRANTVSVGSAGNERQVTNVAKGEKATDAVNMSQLNEALAASYARQEEHINDVWTQLNHKVDEASRQANRGIASAAALVNNMPYIPGTTTMNAGVANYRGENALGIGMSRWSDSGRVNINAGVSQAEGDSAIVRVGVGFVFD